MVVRMEQLRPVRAFHRYAERASDKALGTVFFCGRCELDLGGIGGHDYYGAPQTISEFLEEMQAELRRSYQELPDSRWIYYRFCPWCGLEFPEEWRNAPVENDRVIDHFRRPGWHRGDTHEFVGTFEQHWLSVSGGDELCWCEPTVTPGIAGCVIRHTAIDYETHVAMLKGEKA